MATVGSTLKDLGLPHTVILNNQKALENSMTDHCPIKRITDPRHFLWVSSQHPNAVRLWLPGPLAQGILTGSMAVLPEWEEGSFDSSCNRYPGYRMGHFRGPKGLVVLWVAKALQNWHTKVHLGLEGDYEFDDDFNWSKDSQTTTLTHDEWLVNVETEPLRQEGPRTRERSL